MTYADDINTMGRTKRAKVYEELKERAKEVGLNISTEKNKSNSTKQEEDILTLNDHDTKVIRSFKYLRTVINNTKDETVDIKARILGANKAHYSANFIDN
jgi:hypothetical protein